MKPIVHILAAYLAVLSFSSSANSDVLDVLRAELGVNKVLGHVSQADSRLALQYQMVVQQLMYADERTVREAKSYADKLGESLDESSENDINREALIAQAVVDMHQMLMQSPFLDRAVALHANSLRFSAAYMTLKLANVFESSSEERESATTHHIALRVNDAAGLSHDMQSLIGRNASDADLKLIIDRVEFRTHKQVLAARSATISRLLLNETTTSTLKLSTLLANQIENKSSLLRLLINYVYSGQLEIVVNIEDNLDDVFYMLAVSELLELSQLSASITACLHANTNTANVARLYELARLCEAANNNSFAEDCARFMDARAARMASEPSFFALSSGDFESVIARDTFYLPEASVFELVKEWHERNNLSEIESGELMERVRFDLLDLPELVLISHHVNRAQGERVLDELRRRNAQQHMTRLADPNYRCGWNMATDNGQGEASLTSHRLVVVRGEQCLIENGALRVVRHRLAARGRSSTDSIVFRLVEQQQPLVEMSSVVVQLYDHQGALAECSFVVEVSSNGYEWTRVAQIERARCSSRQHVNFDVAIVVKYIQITGRDCASSSASNDSSPIDTFGLVSIQVSNETIIPTVTTSSPPADIIHEEEGEKPSREGLILEFLSPQQLQNEQAAAGTLLAGISENTNIKIYSLETTKSVQKLNGAHTRPIRALEWLPRGRLASAGYDRIINVWHVATGERQRKLVGHTKDVTDLRWLATSARLVSASEDATIRVWNVNNGECARTLVGHSMYVLALEVVGVELIASGSADKTIRVWNLANANSECERTLVGHTNDVSSLKLVARARLASASNDKRVRVWDLENGECVLTLAGHASYVVGLALVDANRLASAAKDNTIKVWNLESGECARTLRLDDTKHTGAAFETIEMLGENRLASATSDGAIRIWDLSSGKSKTFRSPEAHVQEFKQCIKMSLEA